MPNLESNTAGIISPNPFWLASAPPTNSGRQIMRAFDAGWGGAVWKTVGQPIQNTSSRFGGLAWRGQKGVGFNNIELITDRTMDTNFREIAEVKKRFPNHALIVSLMVESKEEWKEVIDRSVDAGADGIELNFGCPHGMCERGMGSAVGQEPEVNERITSWAKEFSTIPVLVKLTPNVSDIVPHGLAAQAGGADGVSLINTVKSIISVDVENFVPRPSVGGKSTNGGYCGAAVRPIALHMVGALSRSPEFRLPISGIGGITDWSNAVEFLLLGASSVQVCTEVMLRGYRIVEDMIDGLENYMRRKGLECLGDFIGRAIPAYTEWGELDINFESVARIDPETCIGCQKCVVACHDGAHQCIHPGPEADSVPIVDEPECVGCNLCEIVCPVPDCIQMVQVDNGLAEVSWNEHLVRNLRIREKKGSHGYDMPE